MSKVIFILFAISLIGCSKGKSLLTVAFPASYEIPYQVSNHDQRFTPSVNEIDLAEKILIEQLRGLNQNRFNQGIGCPAIDKKLNKYARQYVGYINKEGERIIWINAVWHSKVPDYFEEDVVFILDGCSYYWNIEVNLTIQQASNLQVNGMG